MTSVLRAGPAAAVQETVCVMVPTFRRPATLAALLRALRAQTVKRVGVELLVVDNDAAQSARALVESSRHELPFPVHYLCVETPGLCAVRNAGLEFARRRFRFVAMVDDDEIPEPQWLEELLRTQARTGAAAVIGPVPARLPPEAPAWIRAGKFFDLPTFPDQAIIADGYTGNCLIDLDAASSDGLAFDAKLNLAGGEDQLFFRELIARGGRIAYAARAVAPELVAAARVNARYLVRLSFRRGNTLWFCDRRIHGRRAPMLARRVALALGRIALGAVMLVPRAIVSGRAGVVRSLCDAARGAGTLAGLCGITYLHYRRAPAGSGE